MMNFRKYYNRIYYRNNKKEFIYSLHIKVNQFRIKLKYISANLLSLPIHTHHVDVENVCNQNV